MASSRHIAETLLREAHTPDTAASIFTEKVLHKPLHLRPTSPDPTSQNAREKRRQQRLRKKEKSISHQKVKPLSAKEKRVSGIYDIPNDAKKYEIYEPLHRMWVGYMWEVLGIKEGAQTFVTAQGAGSKLTSADYHGAEVKVVRSRCVGMVGLSGIVVRDTKFTFQVITKLNKLKSEKTSCGRGSEPGKIADLMIAVPKRHTVFRIAIPQPELRTEQKDELSGFAEQTEQSQSQHLIFELHGSQFETKATDRATKKYKWQKMNDL
ncbi:ribonuclease P protein subunit POP4, partial [Lecanoromycetidae sp. Uapishka_2]